MTSVTVPSISVLQYTCDVPCNYRLWLETLTSAKKYKGVRMYIHDIEKYKNKIEKLCMRGVTV